MTDSCKYRFRLYNKNHKLILQRFSESMIKTTFLSWQIYVQKYPEEVDKNCLYKVWDKNADRIYAEIVLICMIQTSLQKLF